MVSKTKLLTVFAVLLILLPLLGIARQVKDILLYVVGVLILLISFLLRRHIKVLRLKLKRIEGQQGTFIQ